MSAKVDAGRSAHTPGPWETEATDDHGSAVRVMDEGEATVALCYQNPCDDAGTAEVNARLIAAAPELLAALEECITDENANCIVTNDVAYTIRRFKAINKIARAAIARALGNE